jgi:hypothetical protein
MMLGFLKLKNLGKPACTCFVYFDSKNKSIDAENWVMCLVQLRWTSGRQQFSRDEDAQKRAVSYTFTQKKKLFDGKTRITSRNGSILVFAQPLAVKSFFSKRKIASGAS